MIKPLNHREEAFSKKHRQQWDTARRRLTFGSGHESDVCSETLWLMKTHFQNKARGPLFPVFDRV